MLSLSQSQMVIMASRGSCRQWRAWSRPGKPAARINLLGAAAQDAHQTQRRVLVQQHVGVCALLSHREVFPGGVHHVHANTTPVDTRQVGLLLGFHVEDLGMLPTVKMITSSARYARLLRATTDRTSGKHARQRSIQLIGPAHVRL